jgi:trimeric autotransporter adhesin
MKKNFSDFFRIDKLLPLFSNKTTSTAPPQYFTHFWHRQQLKTVVLVVGCLVSVVCSAFAASRFAVANGDWNSTATWSATSGGTAGASVPVAGDAVTITGFTVTVSGTQAATSLTLGASGVLTNNSSLTLSGSVGVVSNVSAGTLTQGTNATLTIGGSWNASSGVYATLNATASGNTVTLNGSGNQTMRGTTYNNLTISSSAGTKSFNGGAVILHSDFTVPSGVTFTTNGQATTFNGDFIVNGNINSFGASAITIGGTKTTQSIAGFTTTGSVSMTKTAGTATFTGNVQGSSLTMSGVGGTLNLGSGLTHTMTSTGTSLSRATSTILNGGSSTLKLAGNGNGGSGSASTFEAGTGTVEYNGGGAQTVGFATYNNLTFTGASTKTVSGTLTVNGNLTINTGATLSHAGTGNTITVLGNWANNGTFSPNTTSTVSFTGASTQTITGATTFNNLTVSGTTVGVTIANDQTVNGALALGAKKITTGSNKIILPSTGSLSRTSGYIVGNLQKNVATGSNIARTFEIGDATNYSPVTTTFANVTTAGDVTATVATGTAPDFSNSGLDQTKYVNRYWTLSNASTAFDTYQAAFTYVSGDLQGGASTSALIVGRNSGGWTLPAVSGRTSTSVTTTSSITGFGDFALAESGCVVPTISSQTTPTATYCQNTTATALSVTASGTSLTYQWYSNIANSNSGGTLIGGATSATYTPLTTSAGTLYYYCVVSEACGSTVKSAVSGAIIITASVTPSVTIAANPSGTICEGRSVTFTPTPTNGGTPTYKWKKGGVDISGATGTTYTSTTLADGDIITVEMTSTATCASPTTATSTGITMSVTPAPTITGTLTVCAGATTQLTGSGTPDATTPWASATTSIATISSTGLVTGVAGGTSVITYTDNTGCTKTATVTVRALPTITGTTTVCTGLTTQLTGSGTPATTNPWVSADPSKATIDNTGLVTGVASGSSVITYTDINGCTRTATVNVNVGATITASTLNGCIGTTITLTGNTPVAATDPWVSASTGVATISGTAGTGTVTGVSAGTSVITFTKSNGCFATATVTINTRPTISHTKTDDPCQIGAGAVSITINGGAPNYTINACGTALAPHPSAGTTISVSDSPATVTTTGGMKVFSNLQGNVEYKFTVTDANGCTNQ